MNKEKFLLKDHLNTIKSRFIENGWVTIYDNPSNDINDQSLVYCYMIDDERFESYKLDGDWKISPGGEGKPSVYGDGTYKTYADEGIEPFIFSKHFNFNEGSESYVDISEEFVLYFKLYEKSHVSNYQVFVKTLDWRW